MRPTTAVVLAVLLLFGCDASDSRVAELQAEVTTLKDQVGALKAQVEKQKQDHELEKLLASFENIAFLTPGAEGYAVVTYDLGALTVQLADVKPYANGSKATLKFGNPLAATVTGLKLTIDWGRVDANNSPDNSKQKSKDLTLTQEIRSGAWSSVPIVLDGIPANELGFVRVREVTHTGVRLTR
jgi:hypothetical protein